MTLTQIVDRARLRRGPCRRGGHVWTEMATPVACMHCGRVRRSEYAR
ncbi:MAG: hypothetical protein QOG01_2678 [Pseudonocardiales bacterium]|jgi:hypothetical protein|nr:hypothetical protein [Pseudonocardiales bacterium]